MKVRGSLLGLAMLVAGPIYAQTPRPASSIAASGDTVVTANFPNAKVVASIRTARLDGSCASECPASRTWTTWGAKRVTVVKKLSLSVNGHPVPVPLSVYAALFQPGDASLADGHGHFTLRIRGGDGSEAYFVVLTFTAHALDQLRVYGQEAPAQPTQVTTF